MHRVSLIMLNDVISYSSCSGVEAVTSLGIFWLSSALGWDECGLPEVGHGFPTQRWFMIHHTDLGRVDPEVVEVGPGPMFTDGA